ncbi:YciI family protein [Streptomyces sp. NPDC052051]|uniref:YciI family protein n=1 Tax=Streptomyces sp. NPDC052051 TaxID=3154649 RepID=UPI003441D03B
MFLITFTYRAPLAAIDKLKDEHYTNPAGLFGQGMVRLAGRMEPRTGGLVIAEGSREAVEAAVASDPFVLAGAAEARIVEFHPTWGDLATPA